MYGYVIGGEPHLETPCLRPGPWRQKRKTIMHPGRGARVLNFAVGPELLGCHLSAEVVRI